MQQGRYGGFEAGFWERRPLIGMVHLPPLPGSARDNEATMAKVCERAVADAQALAAGGADALVVENFFDAPFAKERVPPHTIAAMTRAVGAVRNAVALPIGVNVLRNDVRAALAVAHVCSAQFVRVNVYVGVAVTDQGLVEGAARTAVLYRRELGADVAIWADVFVKHAAQLGTGTLEDAAKNAVERGLADVLIVSGAATGTPADAGEVRRVKQAVPATPVVVGSGFTAETAAALLAHADGAIVGMGLKPDGRVDAPIDVGRVRALRAAMSAPNRPD